MRNNVIGGQINLQKGQTGVCSLLQYLLPQKHTKLFGNKNKNNDNAFLICLQEPPTNKGRIVGFGSSGQLLYDRSSKRPRAAIFASRDLDIWLVPEFTNGDIVTCIWKTNSIHRDVIVVSVYMDILDDEVLPKELIKLMRKAQRKDKEVIICADSNAHSSLWGCEDTNKRGEKVEEIIFSRNLTLHNTGDHFTFHNRRAQTIIDITMSTNGIAEAIKEWHVSEEVQGSDHLLINFQITISSNEVIYKRDFEKGDWDLFQAHLDRNDTNQPDVWTTNLLEYESNSFEEEIQKAVERSFPRRPIRTGVRNVSLPGLTQR